MPANTEDQGADQIAWAAGLFEGEGSVYAATDRRVHTPGHKTLAASLQTTDHDVLLCFKAVVGCGRLTGPYTSTKSTKPYWIWQTRVAADVRALFEKFEPWLGERRIALFREAIECCDSQAPGRIGRPPGPRLIEGQLSL
jgi:hypothetical protein